MITALRTVFRVWTPWEEAVIKAMLAKFGTKTQAILRSQLSAVTRVQRILGWIEIDLYVMKKGKVDRSGIPALFDDREFVLAKTITRIDSRRISTSIVCVGGYLFSLNSDQKVRDIAFRKDLDIEVAEFDRRFS